MKQLLEITTKFIFTLLIKNHWNTHGIFRMIERSEQLFKMLIFERVQIFKMVDDWWKSRSGKCVSSQTVLVRSRRGTERCTQPDHICIHDVIRRLSASTCFDSQCCALMLLSKDVINCTIIDPVCSKVETRTSRDQKVFRLRILD